MSVTVEMVQAAQEAYERAPSLGWAVGKPAMRYALEAAISMQPAAGSPTFEEWLAGKFGNTISDVRVIALMRSAWQGRGDFICTAEAHTVKVAKVTVDDETIVVRAGEEAAAIQALAGDNRTGAQVDVEHGEMSSTAFASLPEYQ